LFSICSWRRPQLGNINTFKSGLQQLVTTVSVDGGSGGTSDSNNSDSNNNNDDANKNSIPKPGNNPKNTLLSAAASLNKNRMLENQLEETSFFKRSNTPQ
jgi:hypothetical protein